MRAARRECTFNGIQDLFFFGVSDVPAHYETEFDFIVEFRATGSQDGAGFGWEDGGGGF